MCLVRRSVLRLIGGVVGMRFRADDVPERHAYWLHVVDQAIGSTRPAI
jgi:hypothetical protein